MLFKSYRNVPIGLILGNGKDFNFINSSEVDYLRCENKYNVDYFYKDDNIQPAIAYPKQNSIFNVTFFHKMKICNLNSKLGIKQKFLPYFPRPSRCDCIMSALSCIVNP